MTNCLLLLESVVFWGAAPDDEVGPEAEASADKGYQEDDAHDGDINVQIFGYAATNARNLAVGGASHEFFYVVFHNCD